jgi:hypothetical protein
MISPLPIRNRREIAWRFICATRNLRIGAIVFLLSVFAVPAHAAEREERQAVLATVQRLFDGMAARDQAALMANVIPEGRITSHGVRDGHVVVRTGSWSDWAARIAGANERLEERMYNPRVRIRGSLATVWTEYTLRRNGTFSHCGIDLFDMAKVDGRWRILNITFTVETEGCRRR